MRRLIEIHWGVSIVYSKIIINLLSLTTDSATTDLSCDKQCNVPYLSIFCLHLRDNNIMIRVLKQKNTGFQFKRSFPASGRSGSRQNIHMRTSLFISFHFSLIRHAHFTCPQKERCFSGQLEVDYRPTNTHCKWSVPKNTNLCHKTLS